MNAFFLNKQIYGEIPLVIFLFGTLLLGPVSLVRYAYPLMLVWPLFVIPILDKKTVNRVITDHV